MATVSPPLVVEEDDRKVEDEDSGVAVSSSSSPSTSSSSGITTPNHTDERGMCGLTELVSSCLSAGKAHASPSASCSSSAGGSVYSLAEDGGVKEEKNDEWKNKIRHEAVPSSHSDTQPFFRCSQFSNVPPTVRFYTKGTKVTKPNRKIQSRLTWCHNSLLPIVMRQSLAASHFKVVDESLYWVGYWGRHLKSTDYKGIKPHQKVNHFPGAFHIGRKDRLWMHVAEQIDRFGDEYRIVPETYILPREADVLAAYLEQHPEEHVIVKPPASARGTGISVTRKLKDIKAGTALIAQHYVARPMTINGAKFDLRLYAYVPSLEPLRVYLYEEGLVRFASVPYSHSLSTVSNKYMHLTNYSINKLAEKDGVLSSPVPKWKLTELWSYFEERGIDSKKILRSIEEVIVKAFIACEKPIREHMGRQIHSGFMCHELFGVDILLDESGRPWLLETNISPSLHSGTPLDVSVKAPLAKDVLNMAGIYITNGPVEAFKTTTIYASRPRRWPKSSRQLEKERECECAYAGEGVPSTRSTQRLTPDDVRILVEFEDEYARRGDFRLLFPTDKTVPMMRFFQDPIYTNILLQRWQLEQTRDRAVGVERLEKLCREGVVLMDEADSESEESASSEDDENNADEDSEEDVGE